MPAAATPNTCVKASENWVRLEKCTVTERTDEAGIENERVHFAPAHTDDSTESIKR